MATVDSLDIRISAQANSASASLDKLAGKLNTLSTSLSRINGSGLTGLANGVNRLSNSMQSMKSVGTADFTRLAKNVQKLSQIDTASINSAASAMHQMSKGFAQLNNVSVSGSAKQLGELARGISQLGYKSATQAITNIPKLATAMKDLMRTLSTAPKVSQNLINMTNALAKLARTGASSGKAADSLARSFDRISASSVRTSKSIGRIHNSFRGLFKTLAPFLGIYEIFRFGKNAVETASNLTEVQNVVDVTFGKYADLVEKMSDTSIADFGMSELTVKQISSRFQAMGTAMGFAQGRMADMSIELTKLAADMASFYNVEQTDVAEDLESIFTGQTRPLRTYGLDLTEATLKEWAMKQGLDANIDSMSQAEKTMLRYQYVLANTGAAQGDFARTADTWANQVRILKQNFEQLGAVIGGTLINALKPLVKALNAAMGYIISFAKTISNALGKIFGWTYEESSGGGFTLPEDFAEAAGSAEDIADATGDAAKNAKKLRQQLQGFDALNNLTSSIDTAASGASGGAGTGGGAGAGAGGGDWKPGESILKKFESDIDSLYELGEYIGKALTDAMNRIDWDSVYEKARNFGKGLADFLNGLISPELFGALGRTIAGSLNTALWFLNSFGNTFDWKDFGLSIATGINEFFRTFNFSLLADTINVWAHGILDTIIEVLDNTDWTLIGTQIGTFLADLDFIGIGEKIAEAIWKAIGAAWETFKASFSVAPIETALLGILALPALVGFGSKIITLIANPFIKVYNLIAPIISMLGSAISSLGTFIGGLSAPVLVVAAAITALVAGLGYVFATNEEVRQSFDNAINSIKEGLQPAIEFLTGTLLPDLKSGWDRILEILKPLGEFLEGAFTSIWQDMINPALMYIGQTVLPKVTGAFGNLWNNVLVPLGNFLASVLEPVIKIVSDLLSMLWQNVVVPLADAIGNVLGAALEGLIDIFNSVLVPTLNTVIEVLQFLWDNVLSPLADHLKNTLQPVFETVFSAIGGIIEGLGQTLGGLIDFITGVFTGNWKKAWEGVKNIFKGIFNGVLSIVEGVVNNMIGGLNRFLKGFDGVVTKIGDVIGIDIAIPQISKISIPKFETGGFPEDGLFYANHTELVGEFNNGKTAVANNEQITAGIEEAAYRGMMRAIQESGGFGSNVNVSLEGDASGMFRVVKNEVEREARRRNVTPASVW